MRAIPTSPTLSYIEARQRITGNPHLTSEIKLLASQLTIPARILHLIITYNLLPCAGHRDKVTFMDAFLIDHILQGRPVNLTPIILSHMIDVLSHRAKSFPFGTILCYIFTSRDIIAPSTEILSHMSENLTASTLWMMGYNTDEHGQWMHKHAPPPDRATPKDVPESSQTPDISTALQQL